MGAPAQLPPSYRSASPTSHTAFSIQEGCPGFAEHGPQGDEEALWLGPSMTKASSITAMCLSMFSLEGMELKGAGGQSKGGIKDIAGATLGLKEK